MDAVCSALGVAMSKLDESADPVEVAQYALLAKRVLGLDTECLAAAMVFAEARSRSRRAAARMRPLRRDRC